MKSILHLNNLKVEILETTGEKDSVIYYEKHKNVVHLRAIDHDKSLKRNCEACRRFGKNLACPPFSPAFNDYISNHAGQDATATILCIRIPLEQFGDIVIPEERYRTGYKKAKSLLVDELLSNRKKGHVVLGSGACLECEKCVIELGDNNCKFPSRKIYSLESLGINVISLSQKAFDFNLEWSGKEYTADYVSSIGAVMGKGVYVKGTYNMNSKY